MSNILVINSSAAGRDSVSRVLVADAVSKLLEVNPHSKVTHRDLGENPPPHLVAQTLNGVRGTAETELEFVAWLCLQAQAAQHDGRDAAPFRRAARDFLDRHLAAWLPAFRRKLEASDTAYVEYATALGALVDHHRRQLEN